VAYLIKRNESLGRAIKRTVREQLDEALQRAQDRRRPVDERIHEMRARLKRTRAAVRLVEDVVGREAKNDDRVLRDVGRMVARPRDRAAEQQALRSLSREMARRADEQTERGPAEIERQLQRALHLEDAESHLGEAVRELARARRRVCRW
jgi:hypothetical protein